MENTMFALADRLKTLRNDKKSWEDALKQLGEEIEKVERELSDLMIQEETQSFNRAGTMFYLTTKLHASMAADMKEQLFQALRSQGFGSLIYETINANSLSAFTKEQVESSEGELPEWLQGLVNVFEKTTVALRKAK